MLQRQQASAIVAACGKIVEGAVGRVGMALDMLNKCGVVRQHGHALELKEKQS